MSELRDRLAQQAIEWVGVPYLHRGTTRRGCDCTGLLIGVLGELHPTLNYPLRKYPKDWNLHAMAGDYIREELSKVAEPLDRKAEPGDLLLFYFGRCVAHCAIVTGPLFVHAHVSAGKVEYGSLRTKKWARRLADRWRIVPEKLERYL